MRLQKSVQLLLLEVIPTDVINLCPVTQKNDGGVVLGTVMDVSTLSRLKYFNTIKITHYNCGIIWPNEQWGAWMGIEVY